MDLITRRHALCALTLVAAVHLGPMPARADWPNFRGPNHDGISGEKIQRPLRPTVLWEREIGSGFSSFAAVGDRVYTAGTRDGKQVLYCIDAEKGAEVWSRPIEDAHRERQGGDGPRATPSVDGDLVYMMGARGTVICVDAAAGTSVAWEKRFGDVPGWGYSGSVLIEGDLAVFQARSGDGALVAVDKKTGEQRWARGSGPAGYATPYPFTLDGTRYIAGFLGRELIVVEASEGGEVAWTLPWRTSYDVNAATPIFDGGSLFISSGYHHGSALYQLKNQLKKQGPAIVGRKLWENQAIRAKFQTPVLYKGHLYTSDETGLKCVEFRSGRVRWSVRRQTHGTILIASGPGLIFYLTEKGELQIAPADHRGFKPVFTASYLSSRCWSAPVLHRGRLYMRNFEKAVCVDLARKPGT